ncbi:hypothetical protein [Variovorax sp. J22P240]|uniref:hypothetical protein n=1 Tax=Variovorax sp. J22P240 TaxID=3053514 RepID=UPI002578D1A9|nr:hypothetical protein [Variovorax sp. J22P240]
MKLIPAADWKLHHDHYVAMLGQPAKADALLDPLLANARAGLVSVADALSDGKLTIHPVRSLGQCAWLRPPARSECAASINFNYFERTTLERRSVVRCCDRYCIDGSSNHRRRV